MKFNYDVIVIGGGHAGCEAACAAANMGASTCLITMDMNKIAQMSCNPAIGGIAKGQIVREIDALGGFTGIVTDATTIQFRMLNLSKGPAVWSPRAQCDRGRFIWKWREVIDNTPNLTVWQDQVDYLTPALPTGGGSLKDSHSDGKGNIKSPYPCGEGRGGVITVRTIWGAELTAPCVVLTAGTFLNGLMHIGRKMVEGGRIAEPAAKNLTECLNSHGIRSARMKTGTPVRIDKRSVHFDEMELQEGDKGWHKFSFLETSEPRNPGISKLRDHETPQSPHLPCWITYTNPAVHDTLRSGLADSPLYNGQIKSIGPRYCPSIETKLMTFPDKEEHLLFLEPEGSNTNEMYLNGFSSSLQMDVQIAALRQIPAFRDIQIYRPGYAIEYDFFDPTQLKHTLESKIIDGLFFAGQVNGTTGYEEAAGQGLVAGINAAIKAGHYGSGMAQNDGLVLKRDEAYIGVLIDDLVIKGVDEPYRMFTSRAEHRILLRQDNADERLTEMSYRLGLATRGRYEAMKGKYSTVKEIVDFCYKTNIGPRDANVLLEQFGTTPLHYGAKLAELIARPQLDIYKVAQMSPQLQAMLDSPSDRKEEIAESAEIQIKYRGYIEREKIEAEKIHRLEGIRIKGHFNYAEITQLSTEARQKLERQQPETLAQASRIPGVSPNDISVLLVLLGR